MSESDKYGPPPPPPPLPERDANDDNDDDDDDSDDGDAFMPSLPPHMRKHSERKTTPPSPSPSPPAGGEEQESGSEDGDEYCPALPPHMMPGGGGGGGGATVGGGGTRGTGVGTNSKTRTNAPTAKQSAGTKRVLGPTLPDFAIPKNDSKTPVEEQLEEEEEGEEDVPVIGPLPPAVKVSREEYRAREFEERARRMKDKLEGRNVDTNKPLVRESWMTELPEDKPNFCGLGARQFLRKTPAEKGDRSCWTDTPADRARKEKEKQKATEGTSVEEGEEEEEAEEAGMSVRDQHLTEKVDEYNKTKRGKSLVDLHRKELKRKQSSENKPKERRPFSREEDLSINKFDDAQKDAVMKKARQLNDRFSAGKAKFL